MTAANSPLLRGKAAVVTGASSGFGRAISRRLVDEGVRVVGGARRPRMIDAGVGIHLDATSPESCEQFVRCALDEIGAIDYLMNNAGVGQARHPFAESDELDEEVVLGTNLAAAVRMVRLCLPHIRRGGHIVNIGSIAGRRPYLRGATYAASKWGLRGFTYALREDLLGRPLRVTTIDPGMARTGFAERVLGKDPAALAAAYAGVRPLDPDDVAECVVFALTRPSHVNIDEIVVTMLDQTPGGRVWRDDSRVSR